jgi:drug/metabolite transporter (DMT)-like permease
MIDLFLSILFSTSIAIILKINSNNNGNSILLLVGNYFSASLVGLFLFLSDQKSTTSTELIPLGFFLSILFVGSIFAFSKSVSLSGAALSTVSSRLSVFVPTILAMFFYREFPNIYQLIGLFLTIITIVLFYLSIANGNLEGGKKDKFIYLIAILLGIGFADFFMKVFQENWSSTDKSWFLFWIFFFSFLITAAIALKQKRMFEKSTLILGIFMGIPNIFSSYFLIEALKSYTAVFVYPFVNMSIIIATAIIVKIFWKEQWSNYSKIALFIGLASILMLSL